MRRRGKGRESKNNGTQKELEWRYLTWVGTKRGCWRKRRTGTSSGRLSGGAEQRAARGCLCLLRSGEPRAAKPGGGQSVGCLPSPTGMTDAGGQVTLGRAGGKKVLGPLVPRNPTCASVAAQHPLWALGIDSLHHTLRTAGHLWMPSRHCRRLEGACRVGADCALTASHPPLLVVLCAIGLNATGRRPHRRGLRASRRPGQCRGPAMPDHDRRAETPFSLGLSSGAPCPIDRYPANHDRLDRRGIQVSPSRTEADTDSGTEESWRWNARRGASI